MTPKSQSGTSPTPEPPGISKRGRTAGRSDTHVGYSGFLRTAHTPASCRLGLDPAVPQSWVSTQPTGNSPDASLVRNPTASRGRDQCPAAATQYEPLFASVGSSGRPRTGGSCFGNSGGGITRTC